MGGAFAAAVMVPWLMAGVYRGCQWLTAPRGEATTFCFAWERHIPLVPIAIVPYLSWLPLLAAAPFLVPDRTRLRTWVGRVVVATALCGIGFCLWPLRFGEGQVAPPGVFGGLYRALWAVDHPGNQFPSLHVAATVILWPVYARAVGGRWRWPVHGWLLLTIASTLLTHQHHVVDVAGGTAVGILSCGLFRDGVGLRSGSPAAGARA